MDATYDGATGTAGGAAFGAALTALAAGEKLDAATLATIKRVFDQTGRILDPHTAVAASAAEKLKARPLVVLSTAHPAKFPDAVAEAIGHPPEVPAALARLANLPEKLDILPNTLPLLRQFISSRLAA